ncbi:Pectinesterase, catalytic [Sesbania bispinosa]|nr:Pectinesterase, catalytic [Sesbania bispinosa]
MVVSMLLIALVTIAVVANMDGSKQGAGTMKTLLSVCGKTEEPESCVHVLKNVGERATVLDYVKASINATLEEMLVVNMPKPYLEKSLTPLQQMSYRDCLELLILGKEELESLYTMITNSFANMSIIDPDDVINSLSAVISYQQTCSDLLMRTNSYEILGYSLKIPIMVTRITLAIVNNFSEWPKNGDHKQNEIPTLFSGAERQLIEFQRNVGDKQPYAVVAQDGSSQFSTISESLNACSKNNQSPCIIYVKKGKYEERVVVPKDLKQVVMYGDGPDNTIVSGITTRDPNMVTTTLRAATFVVLGKGFICKNMGFTAPAAIIGAPALLVFADHAAFFNCKIDGEEGSLYAVAQRQFYRDCEIHGSVDIIKGDSATLIQNSQIIVKPRNSSHSVLSKNVVTAQSRLDKYERTGFVIQNCSITAQGEGGNSLVATTYLGTPCNEYSRTIIMESFLGDVINPEGWCKWSDNYGIETATFREFNNRGPAAKTITRVNWDSYRTIIQRSEMASFTATQFLESEKWLQSSGIPYDYGFVYHKENDEYTQHGAVRNHG